MEGETLPPPEEHYCEACKRRTTVVVCSECHIKASNSTAHYKECWDMTCGQIKGFCVRLGADDGDMTDAWLLKDLIEQIIRERDQHVSESRRALVLAEAVRAWRWEVWDKYTESDRKLCKALEAFDKGEP